MSATDGPAVKATVEQGRVEARAFRDGRGKLCVLVVGIGPGPAAATIQLPTAQKLKSTRGGTEALGPTQYRFTRTDICSDIRETNP